MIILYQFDRRIFFISLCGILIFYVFATKTLLISETLYYNSLSEQLSYERIEALIDNQEKWEWVSYVFIPVWYSLKFTLVACCLWLGFFFANTKARFGDLFGVAMLAEVIGLLPPLLKILWFSLWQTEYTFADLQWFAPLSALSLFNTNTIEPFLAYPLQLLSVWELGYWLLLAYGVGVVSRKSMTEGMRIVATSYGPALVLWLLLITFLSVSVGQ